MGTPLPTITAITVCRNAIDLIEKTIQSVLAQTYPNVEYILVDGASTDGTLSIIEKYAGQIARYVSEPDHGIYDAMNKGLSYATGEWVNFMNAGDTFAGTEVLSSVFCKSEGEEIPSHIKVIGGHTHLLYPEKTEVLQAQGGSVVPYALPFCHQSSFVRRTLDGASAFQFNLKYRIAADYHLFYRIYQQYGAEAFYTVDSVIANYRMDGSTTFENLRKAKKEYLQITSSYTSPVWWKQCLKYILRRP